MFEDTLTLRPRRRSSGEAPIWTSTHAPGATADSLAPRRRWSTEAKLLLAALIVILCLTMAAAMTVLVLRDYARSTRTLDRVADVLVALQAVEGQLVATHTTLLAYLADGDERHLERRAELRAANDRTLLDLRNLVGGEQQQALDAIRIALSDHVASQREIIRLRRAQGREAAWDALAAQSLDSPANRVTALVERLVARENEVFVAQRQLEEKSKQALLLSAGSALCLFLLASLLLFAHIRSELRLRTRLGRERDASRHFLESVITAIPHPILIKDGRTLSYLLVNPAMSGLLGRPVPEAVEHNDYSFFPADRAARAEALDWRALLDDCMRIDVVQVPTAAQGERTFRVIRLPFRDEDSGRSYLLVVAEDISEFLEVQEELRKANRNLERQAQELRAALGELGSFSHTVSHDLRTPLRAIDGFAQVLDEDYGSALDESARRYLHIIRDSSQRMGALIDALVHYTRIGKEPLEMRKLDMKALVDSACRRAESAHPDAGARWEIADLPPASGDPALIGEVWNHLLDNALKFRVHGRPAQIRISGILRGREAVYTVDDNGVGFDMRYYPKLFGLLQRLHGDEIPAGAGMGLAAVQRILVHHGGRVWAEGTPGAGARFHFSLPLSRRAAPASATESNAFAGTDLHDGTLPTG